MAESLVRLGKRTSKVNTFKPPEAKVFKGYDDIFQTNKQIATEPTLEPA
jgi:hypothetical protein